METPVHVRISYISKNYADDTVSIDITDHMSGMAVASVEVSFEQFTSLLATRGAHVMAELPSEKGYSRVGKRYRHKTVEGWPEEDWKRSYGSDPTEDMKAWAQEFIEDIEPEWDGYSWTKHNFGWRLSVYRWDETSQEEREARLGETV